MQMPGIVFDRASVTMCGDFLVFATLGFGMSSTGSVVYLAQHKRTFRPVALKWPVPAKELETLREVGAKAPGTVGLPKLLGWGSHSGQHYFASELLGLDLSTVLASLTEKALDQRWALVSLMGRIILRRLEVVHRCGYVHGDVAPHNILMGRAGASPAVLHLIDFGCAQPFPGGRPLPGEEGSMEFSSVRSGDMGEWHVEDDLEALGWTLVHGMFGDLPWFKTLQDLYVLKASKSTPADVIAETTESTRKSVQESKAKLLTEGWGALGEPWTTTFASVPSDLDRFMRLCQAPAPVPHALEHYASLAACLGGDEATAMSPEAEAAEERELRERLGKAGVVLPSDAAGITITAMSPLACGDAVSVWSLSTSGWIEDGIVLEVAYEDRCAPRSLAPGGVAQPYYMGSSVVVPCGSALVVYNRGGGLKWILPWEQQRQLKRRRL